MRPRLAGLLGVALLLCALGAQPASAVHCAIDQVPAATLLMPYFEVDLSSFNDVTTLLDVTNASPAATLAHVTIWTDWGVPALGFDVYFTGYDVQIINLRDVINGHLPQTASVGQDPKDIISPHGTRSTDVSYTSCNGVLPPATLSAAVIADLQAKLKGEPIPSSPTLCAGSPRGNQIARGYVTVDVVTGCTALDPTSPGYFSGVAGNDNKLVGETFITAPGSANTMWTYPVIHLEAATLPPNSPSFYGRYVGDSGADGREPLPSSYAARFLGPSPNATRLLVWRETPATSAPVACSSGPAWVPLATNAVQLLDEATHSFPAAASLPVAANAIDLATDLTNPFGQGLAIFQLDHAAMGGRHAQAVVWRADSIGTLESALQVSQLDDLCANQRYQPLLIDGFENGFVPWAGGTQ